MNILFLLATRANSLAAYYLIGDNCPVFRNGLLDSYFFKLTLRSACFEPGFWRVAFKTILHQQCYKNSSCFQTRALNTVWRICDLGNIYNLALIP